MSHIGELTSTFTPPSECAEQRYYRFNQVQEEEITLSDGEVSVTTHNRNWEALGPTDIAECYPDGFDPSDREAYYSPGVCPSGYAPACSQEPGAFDDVRETTVTCCPTIQSYSCLTSITRTHQSVYQCVFGYTGTMVVPSMTRVAEGETSVLTSVQLVEGGAMNAYGLVIRNQDTTSSSESSTATSSESSGSTPAATSPTTGNPSETASQTPDPTPGDDDDGGLSTGATAGIAVGATLGGILLLALLLWIPLKRWRRKRHEQAAAVDGPAELHDPGLGKPQPYSDVPKYGGPPMTQGPAELGPGSHHEMYTPDPSYNQQAISRGFIQEMDGGSYPRQQ